MAEFTYTSYSEQFRDATPLFELPSWLVPYGILYSRVWFPFQNSSTDQTTLFSSKKLNVDSPSFTPSSLQSSPSGAPPLAPAKKTTFSSNAATVASFVPRATSSEFPTLRKQPG